MEIRCLLHGWCCLWFMMAYAPGSALQVTVDRPDVQGRVRILKVHSRGKQIGKDVDFEKIARRTPGLYNLFSNTCVHDVAGADDCCCANVNVNQLSMTPHVVTCSQSPDAFPSSLCCSMAAACPLHALLTCLPRHGVRTDFMHRQESACTPAILFSTALLRSPSTFTRTNDTDHTKCHVHGVLFLASFCVR